MFSKLIHLGYILNLLSIYGFVSFLLAIPLHYIKPVQGLLMEYTAELAKHVPKQDFKQ